MPRHPRIHSADLLYHLIARGNNGQEIFLDKGDYEKFLSLLKNTKEKYPFKLYSYVLMPNHFHLLLEVRYRPTSRIMQSLLTGYSRYFNKEHRKRGHLFQGRYKGIICEKENYFLELVSYIHLNPVRAKLVNSPQEWKWSGHQEYIGETKRKLIDFGLIRGIFGEGGKGYQKYRKFLEDKLGKEHQEEYYPGDIKPFLGSEEFISQLEKEPKQVKLGERKSLEQVLEEVSKKEGIRPENLRQKLRTKEIAKTRIKFIQKSTLENGHSQADVARFLNCNQAYISRVIRIEK